MQFDDKWPQENDDKSCYRMRLIKRISGSLREGLQSDWGTKFGGAYISFFVLKHLLAGVFGGSKRSKVANGPNSN